jgi:pimeloyl-ACP methyl ester carboxylesterase
MIRIPNAKEPDAMISEHVAKSPRHTTFYLAAGPVDGPPIIFVHGWPELSLSWRHQLPCMGSLGFRAIAPDLRGYGRSSIYRTHDAYAQEHVVADMLELLDALGADKAVWIGHDWGSPVVWNIASHHPQRCLAVASLCVPYHTLEYGLDSVIPLVDRRVYPESEYPAGQWEYMRFYEENFETVTRQFDADPYKLVKALFRKGDPAGHMKPSRTAFVRRDGGWFRGASSAPDVPRDADVVSDEDLRVYAEALTRNSFFGPDSYYMNHTANAAYAARAVNGGYLDMPVLFLAARYDYTCESVTSRLAEPMHTYCRDLATVTIASGHWMAQERPVQVNAALTKWLATNAARTWPHWPDA